ncbi:putative DNA-directed RNA polymerase [Daphnia magna]|uniref:Putative DNA-directed RNA polymerase n=1 Tax=Daphnia magna TaxID=35525 RepID=A0A164H3X6_9CRUS|nr:putative DNA-directed RNA polymerase [Daphnia magna]
MSYYQIRVLIIVQLPSLSGYNEEKSFESKILKELTGICHKNGEVCRKRLIFQKQLINHFREQGQRISLIHPK